MKNRMEIHLKQVEDFVNKKGDELKDKILEEADSEFKKIER